ncbi:MAG: serine protease [candidate division KSB1 bacterium]|nr:serine protease [candidate division KSB1 bacterium]MDZ7302017.1 serine protease [candidate division KSB1 bacterium]MDZ7310199.1 serine protease [candidate division KSB1 bacterium]
MKKAEIFLDAFITLKIVVGAAYAQLPNFNENALVKIFAYQNVELVKLENEGNGYPFVMPMLGHGSGTLISSDGVILTAKHVVEGARFMAVWVPGSRLIYPAQVIYKDDSLDCAFLYIEGAFKNFHGLPITPPPLKKGDAVWAYGYPMQAEEPEPSMTRGIISRFSQKLGWWQMDVAINPGNSGGPIIDSMGNVVGIAVASLKDAESINYALPINTVTKAYAELKSSGRIKNAVQKVTMMHPDKKDIRNALANFVAKVTMAKEKFFEEADTYEDMIYKIFKMDFAKASEELADFAALGSAFYFDVAMIVLIKNAQSAGKQNELKGQAKEIVESSLRRALALAQAATKIDPKISKDSQFLSQMQDAYKKLSGAESNIPSRKRQLSPKPSEAVDQSPKPSRQSKRITSSTEFFFEIEGGQLEGDFTSSASPFDGRFGAASLINNPVANSGFFGVCPQFCMSAFVGEQKALMQKHLIAAATIEPGIGLSFGESSTIFIQALLMGTMYLSDVPVDDDAAQRIYGYSLDAYHLRLGLVYGEVSFAINYRQLFATYFNTKLLSLSIGF